MKSFGGKSQGARLERIRASPLWAGDRFRNVHPVIAGLRDPNVSMPSLADFLCGGERRVPRGPLPSMNPLETWTKPIDSGLRVTWLGHSTVLIEIDGLRVLTDPVWGPRASPSRLAGPKRFQPVPVPLRAMPPMDLVIVSHDHYDHLDYPTIRELAKRDVPFVTSLGVGRAPRSLGRAARAHRRTRMVGVAPSAEYRIDRDRGAVAAFLGARTQRSQRDVVVLVRRALGTARGLLQRRHRTHDGISNDPRTARPVRSRDARGWRLPSGLGRYPSWAAACARGACAARRRRPFLPVHWGTFSLAMHAWDQPVEALLELAPKAGARLVMPRLGEAVEPAHSESVEPWWRVVDADARRPQPQSPAATLPKAMSWPID
jgi:hypothetical protein